MEQLLHSLQEVVVALTGLILAILRTVAPWTPLLAWIAYWLFAVNWKQLYPVLMKGGLIGVVLIGFVAVLAWSAIAGAENSGHNLYGLHVSSVVGKTVYVTGLLVIAMLCGSVQLTGCCGGLCQVEVPPPPDDGHQHH